MEHDQRLDARHQLPVAHRAGSTYARALSIAAILGALLSSASPARAGLKAPGLLHGPKVLHQGLLWSGAAGVSLSSPTNTRVLVPDIQLEDVVVGGGWLVAVDRSDFTAGTIGGRLAPITALQLCDPVAGADGWLDALSGGYLYVVVQAGCLGDRPEEAQVLARIQLSSGRVQRVSPVRAGAVSLVAAGSRLALTYLTHDASDTDPVRVRVDVLDSRHTTLLYSLMTPVNTTATPSSASVPIAPSSDPVSLTRAPRRLPLYSRTQLDAEGDVLVTARFHEGVSHTTALGWWGNAGSRGAHAVVSPADGTLSEGHVAYVSSRGGVQHIDVFNLRTGATRTEVELRGSMTVVGVGLRKTRLAWAQQSEGYMLRGARPCVEFGPVGDPELAQSLLSVSGPPVIVDSPAAVAPLGPPCVHNVLAG